MYFSTEPVTLTNFSQTNTSRTNAMNDTGMSKIKQFMSSNEKEFADLKEKLNKSRMEVNILLTNLPN